MSAASITPGLVSAGLTRACYLTTARVETVLYLALVLEKPLLIDEIERPMKSSKPSSSKLSASSR